MHSTFNNFNRKGMKDLSTLQHFIGCDVSKATLDFAIHASGKDYRSFEHIRVENSPGMFSGNA